MDEVKIANYLNLPVWSVISVFAIIGFIITVITIFRFIPKNQRFTFIVSGFIGGVLGYIIWLESLGKILMP